ncbi:HAD-IIB family hydrolase [uncultured Desulfobacter sp.]|uniref:HAD-IIB family hydrolase n=1 Tax=uncultured Desulfobacter sp. TaxID=240139 RepID=UPI003747CD5D
MMVNRLLLCTDMDRTIIPNGRQVEHPDARPQFAKLCSIPQVKLVYVTGRSLTLVKQAISEYDLPEPEYIISDVGTIIYEKKECKWQEMQIWQERIAKDWQGKTHDQLQKALNTIVEIELQEEHKQNDFKLSYYISMDADHKSILTKIETRLAKLGVNVSLIHSFDEPEQIVLLDILPRNATKKHAIEFLQKQLGYKTREIVFAGDSGNDLQVLSSSIPSILVANAEDDIKEKARKLADKNGQTQALFLAEEENFALGGNYTAGVLQGLIYFVPKIGEKIKIP